MELVKVEFVDEVFVKVVCSDAVAMELRSTFSFRPPKFYFDKRYKEKLWDGYIYLFNLRTRLIYRGLLKYIAEFCRDNRYNIDIDPRLLIKHNFSYEAAESFMLSLKPPFTPRDYQIASVSDCVQRSRRLILSPTSSGKSFLIYSLIRYQNEKTLLIVPNLGLIQQMSSDFAEYGYDVNNIHLVYSGQEKNTDKPLIISTYQSAVKLPKSWFDQIGMVAVDEAHGATAKSFKIIMENLTHCKLRYGFTGTLDGSMTHQMVLEGLFGPVKQFITTYELQERGEASALDIRVMLLKHSEEDCKLLKKATYQQEVDFLNQHRKRQDYIVNLTESLEGNTILLFREVDTYGKILYEKLKERLDIPVYFVSGKVKGKDREAIRNIVKKSDQSIICASVGTFSTGINIPNINNIVSVSSRKARIKILQSIGRGLRLHESKDVCVYYDIADDLSHKSRVNYTFKHLKERLQTYINEKFKYKIVKVEL